MNTICCENRSDEGSILLLNKHSALYCYITLKLQSAVYYLKQYFLFSVLLQLICPWDYTDIAI